MWQTPISSTPDSKRGRYSGRGDVAVATFDADNLAFDRRHRPRVDDLPPRPPRKARAPTRCTVGYAFYEAEPGRPHSQRIPSVRLRGLWLEQLGFAVGCKLQITARAGELVVTVVER
ncbi:SymE family type I addiction module toxin [Xanthomonas euvesicatoria]|uniref:SymE family type I addiction module toxin n=1 Tax=Xanthomonas euvesicatoria TaxID=456327 RepID=UPI001C4730BA|nr:type I toxin-antitoxin system SymE family toxin [Xanthomonas campestris pv. fici]